MHLTDIVSEFARTGDRPALLFGSGRSLSYAELDEQMRRFANRLGHGEKRLVAIAAEASEHAIVAYLAALRSGHAVAMLPPCDERIWDDFIDAFQPDFTFRRADGRWRLIEESRPGKDREAIHPDLALLLMTSGSSGAAKAVRLSHANLDANSRSIAAYLELSSTDRAALVLPLHYSYGLSVLNSHLIAGGSIFFPGTSVTDGDFISIIDESGCTNLSGVPYSYELLERSNFRTSHTRALRLMTVAGGKLDSDLIRLYRDHMRAKGGRFFVMYGQTEATARIAFVPPESLSDDEQRIGLSIPGGSLTLADDEGRPITQSGISGELIYRGPNVMMGYGIERSDLARGAEIEALSTGDIAVRDEQGFFRIVGRKSRFAKIAGLRIGFDVMEQALLREGIAAAVLGDDAGLQVYVVDAGSLKRAQAILAEASGLPANLISATARARLPRLASGKIDYAGLKEETRKRRAKTPRGVGHGAGCLCPRILSPRRQPQGQFHLARRRFAAFPAVGDRARTSWRCCSRRLGTHDDRRAWHAPAGGVSGEARRGKRGTGRPGAESRRNPVGGDPARDVLAHSRRFRRNDAAGRL
ncbi:AMP-binding protein [Rhizobium sp. Pop5]|uniref:AMP-binding protein n=1 Tax=Rhizobium sp. Pop5 TaxID=1223565 RepID=UPI000B03382D|nr:AMP-binding protein [Rhizobium sp. Pop5]